ncbi:methylated-DNA--[protein]-cysteine S-methyltransferase [Pseudomonas sp.]|uniref:methylated-DNA--[protein]-cysteine S-methyltransferase n=1 Tax=Pseudomonas sp. TaxID=306 RepID=UPI00262FA13E|nr:methylated-DNA--[protein]-cysteine S-methyltransferase [Pseudomonas sp.]
MNAFTAPNVKLNFRAPDQSAPSEIRYAIGESEHGVLLAARGDDEICAILIADRAEQLREEIVVVFPHSHVVEETSGWQREMAQILAVMEGTSRDLLEVNVGGTSFQQKVWQAICSIPYGSTRTYGQISEQLGMPNSARAVAGACAANVLAFAIPCHRVVGSDGSISGYRWGSERKKEILKQEAHL